MSASSGSIEREIDKYQDESPDSSGSYESSSESSGSSNSGSQDEYYSFGVLGIPLKEFQAYSKKEAQRLEIPNLVNKTLPHTNLLLYLISLLYSREKEAGSGRSLCDMFANPHIQQSYLANHIRRSMKHLLSPYMMGGKGM